MFEHLLHQVGSRHGLNPDQARRLLAAWLDRIFDPARGGTAGFVQAFRAQGLEPLATSWIAPGPNRPLTADQLERVFGEAEIAALARALELPAAAVASASAAILPEAVDALSEDGRWRGGRTASGESRGPSPDEHGLHASPVDDAPRLEPPALESIAPQPIRDTAPGPLPSEPAPLYRANDGPPLPSAKSFARRALPWLLIAALLIALALLLRV